MEFFILLLLVFVGFYGYMMYRTYKYGTKVSLDESPVVLDTITADSMTVITDDVVEDTIIEEKPKATLAKKRTRKSGKFVADDKATPDVNEAYKDGKTPTKKTKKTASPNLKIEK